MNRNTLIILLLLFAFFYFNSSNRPRIFPTPFQPTPDSVIPGGGGWFGGGKFLRTLSKFGLALLLFAEPPPPDDPRPATHSLGADGYLTLDHGASL